VVLVKIGRTSRRAEWHFPFMLICNAR
jgi:hypothetical protein